MTQKGNDPVDLITPEEIEALPSDPRAAFVELEWIVRQRIDKETEDQSMDHDSSLARERYVMLISAAAEEYGIDGLPTVEPGQYDENDFWGLRRAAVRLATTMSLRSKRARAADEVALPSNAKARLRKHLTELEAALAAADIPEKRKKALEIKLGQFAAELDKGRSSITVMLAVAASFAAAMHGLSETEDAIIKLPQTVSAIMVLVGRHKAEEEENAPPAALPRPKERKALPPPKNDAALAGGDFDDDVPF